MRTWLLVAVFAVALAGCGAPPYPGTQAVGSVAGRVLSWPCAPVEIAASPCLGRAVAGVELHFTATEGTAGAVATTDAKGAYSIELLPATYSVRLVDHRQTQGPTQVTVKAGQVTTADFSFDSGIR